MNSKHRLLFAAIVLVATGGRAVSMETALFAAPRSSLQSVVRAADVILGAEAGAPTLLGLSALRPFRLVFDPVNRLIEIAPVDRLRR